MASEEALSRTEVDVDVALEFAKLVRELQDDLTRNKTPYPGLGIEFGKEYEKKRTSWGNEFFLVYYVVLRALKLAEFNTTQISLINATLAVEQARASVGLMNRFMQLITFLERLRVDERLEITTTERLSELYVAMWKQLYPNEVT